MLAKFEQKLESMISGAFARAFRSAVQPVEIAAALQRECDNSAQILSRDRRMVPNDFHVELSETDLDRLAPMDSALVDDLSRQLQDHADNQSYVFPGPIRIALEPAEDLTTGRFRIRSQAQARVEGTATATQTRRAMAYVDVNGTHNPLHAPITVVGRGSEADIRINDPGVSRRHIEFHTRHTAQSTVVEAVDLGSTNGMLVDGAKTPRATLRDGSTVKIGSTTMTLRLVVESVEESGV
ncbi:MAG: FhaA domain-containing protein [Nocardioides sp.]